MHSVALVSIVGEQHLFAGVTGLAPGKCERAVPPQRIHSHVCVCESVGAQCGESIYRRAAPVTRGCDLQITIKCIHPSPITRQRAKSEVGAQRQPHKSSAVVQIMSYQLEL
jgi:hypothetical protein